MRFALLALVYIVSALWLVIALMAAFVTLFDLANGPSDPRAWLMGLIGLAGFAFPGVIGLMLAHRGLQRDGGEAPRGPRGFDVLPPPSPSAKGRNDDHGRGA